MTSELELPFFVYGTLRTGEANSHLLRGVVTCNRPAILIGASMFDLGLYPMLIETSERASREAVPIVGELIEIEPRHYKAILRSLDRLEGVDPRHPESSETLYRRISRTVRVQEGAPVTAWVYFGRENVARRGRAVVNGDWKRRFEKPIAEEELSQRGAASERRAASDC